MDLVGFSAFVVELSEGTVRLRRVTEDGGEKGDED